MTMRYARRVIRLAVTVAIALTGCAATIPEPEAPPAPPPTACEAKLAAAGVEFVRAPATRGVPEPLRVKLPLGGMRYRYLHADEPRAWMFMDCALALSLADLGELLARHGVVEVVDLGVYNYRCKSRLRDCRRGMSLHAQARAIDVAGLVTADGSFYSIETDWRRERRGTPFCGADRDGADRFLHAVLCDIRRSELFGKMLTPNFDAAHRNHWHIELWD
jgi:hypothetical protein